jgi:hypothetical protein
MANKYYAVFKGFKPGIYTAWNGEGQAEEQVKGFFGAVHQRFFSETEAQKWLNYKAKGQKPLSEGELGLASIDENKGYAVTLMLQPHHHGIESIMLIGSAIYNVESKKLAESKIIEDLWTEDHARQGKPVIESIALDVDAKPTRKVRGHDSSSYSR